MHSTDQMSPSVALASAGPELQPVQDVLPFHRSSTYKATWVAEVAVVHPSGTLIRRQAHRIADVLE
jgi:hypothetical protein